MMWGIGALQMRTPLWFWEQPTDPLEDIITNALAEVILAGLYEQAGYVRAGVRWEQKAKQTKLPIVQPRFDDSFHPEGWDEVDGND